MYEHLPTLHEGQSHPKRYAQLVCQKCFCETPGNEAHRYEHEVVVGRSSGTHRSSSSNSHRSSARGFSNTQRFGSSNTSGRTYKKAERLILCDDCYRGQVSSDRWRMLLKWTAYIAVGIVALYFVR